MWIFVDGVGLHAHKFEHRGRKASAFVGIILEPIEPEGFGEDGADAVAGIQA